MEIHTMREITRPNGQIGCFRCRPPIPDSPSLAALPHGRGTNVRPVDHDEASFGFLFGFQAADLFLGILQTGPVSPY